MFIFIYDIKLGHPLCSQSAESCLFQIKKAKKSNCRQRNVKRFVAHHTHRGDSNSLTNTFWFRDNETGGRADKRAAGRGRGRGRGVLPDVNAYTFALCTQVPVAYTPRCYFARRFFTICAFCANSQAPWKKTNKNGFPFLFYSIFMTL